MTTPALGGAHALRRELRTLHAVIHRDLLRMAVRPWNTVMMLLHPLVFLFAFGAGLGSLISPSATGTHYSTYLFPGILVMAVQAPALAVGIRLITDRASGLLREILMTPARRGTLLAGLCAGGTAVATCQGILLLALAGTVHLPYSLLFLVGTLGVLALTAFTLTALTAALAVTMTDVETFHTVLGLVMLPLLFTSGAFFPLSRMPEPLTTLAAANPLAYSVDLLHHVINTHTSPGLVAPGVRWAGWTPPPAAKTALLALTGAAALGLATHRFSRPQ
ncbi:ABC transporter permease [Streptomyces olivaceus]|uniref:ABC transporter permease n=1 Tax=Streptomyces olivaceus TaxID=47716 RepID=UPI00363AF469